jgi:zinc transport system permease protein
LRAWPVESGFDLLAALGLALATMILGVMGAFALVFVPPWLAFRRAGDWRSSLLLALAIGVAAYVAAFALALGLDQPFGPVLALLLVVLGLVIA